MERAKLARRAENAFVGAPTGLMDQAASTLCTAGNALFFDCRSFAAEQVPLDLGAAGLEILVLDTKTPHALVDSEYAARREQLRGGRRDPRRAGAARRDRPGCRAGQLARRGDAPPGTPRGHRERPGAGGRRRPAGGPDRRPRAAAGRLARVDAGRLRDHRAARRPGRRDGPRGRRARRPDDRRRLRRLHHRPGRPGTSDAVAAEIARGFAAAGYGPPAHFVGRPVGRRQRLH